MIYVYLSHCFFINFSSKQINMPFIIFLVVIVVIVLWMVSLYNRLVSLRNRRQNAFADIDVQLRQRHDLVPQLVETVKGYASHERGVLHR
jgi:LemA protein